MASGLKRAPKHHRWWQFNLWFSAFSKSSLNIWKFSVHVLLKPSLKDFQHYLPSMWNEHICMVVWTFFGIAFLWDWNENWSFNFMNWVTEWLSTLWIGCQGEIVSIFIPVFLVWFCVCVCVCAWFFFFFFPTPGILWDLSSQTRDWTLVTMVKALCSNHWTARKFPTPVNIDSPPPPNIKVLLYAWLD